MADRDAAPGASSIASFPGFALTAEKPVRDGGEHAIAGRRKDQNVNG
jgi:hypothetical protein